MFLHAAFTARARFRGIPQPSRREPCSGRDERWKNGNATWGGGVDGSFVASANGAWTAVAGQTIPGATAISNAASATGSYGNGASVFWNIGSATIDSMVANPASFHGPAVIGGSGSQLHFDGPMNPYLTVRTGTIAPLAAVITADTGTSTWNVSNYSFAPTNA